VIAHGLIWGIAAGGNITLNSLVWANYFGRLRLGTIRGVVLFVTIAAQAAGAPLFGLMLESGMGTSTVWTISTASFGVAAVLVFLARPPVYRRREVAAGAATS